MCNGKLRANYPESYAIAIMQNGSFEPLNAWKVISFSVITSNQFFLGCFRNPVGVADRNIIPDERIKASSQFNIIPGCKAAYGRLNGNRGGGWCSASSTAGERLMIDVGEIIQACGLATQGSTEWIRYSWVKTFRLLTSLDGLYWEPYQETHGETIVRISSRYWA